MHNTCSTLHMGLEYQRMGCPFLLVKVHAMTTMHTLFMQSVVLKWWEEHWPYTLWHKTSAGLPFDDLWGGGWSSTGIAWWLICVEVCRTHWDDPLMNGKDIAITTSAPFTLHNSTASSYPPAPSHYPPMSGMLMLGKQCQCNVIRCHTICLQSEEE